MSGLLILAITRYNLWSCFNETCLSLKEKKIHSFGNFSSAKYRYSLSFLRYSRKFFSTFLTVFLTEFRASTCYKNIVYSCNNLIFSVFFVFKKMTLSDIFFPIHKTNLSGFYKIKEMRYDI